MRFGNVDVRDDPARTGPAKPRALAHTSGTALSLRAGAGTYHHDRYSMTHLHNIVRELRVIADGMRRIPDRASQESAMRIFCLSNELLLTPEARRSPPPPSRSEAERVFSQPSRQALFRDEIAEV